MDLIDLKYCFYIYTINICKLNTYKYGYDSSYIIYAHIYAYGKSYMRIKACVYRYICIPMEGGDLD